MPDRPGSAGNSDEYAWLFDSDEPSDARRQRNRPPDRDRDSVSQPVPTRRPRADTDAGTGAGGDPDYESTQAMPVDHGPSATQVLPTVGPPVASSRPPVAGGGGSGRSSGGRPPAAGTVPPPAPRGRRKHPVRRTFGVLALLLAAYLVFLIATPAWAWGRIGKAANDTSSADNSRGTTFLVVGSDARDTMTAAEREELGTGHSGGQRTDSIMLLHVPSSGDPTLVSIPRDSYVSIPGHGSNKINAAFSFGGAKLLTQTVEDATGMHIDGYLEIGFVGFVDVVNAVGGVDMCLAKAMKDKDAHVDLKAGCQELDGKQALGFVRARHSQTRGDLDRVENQRKLMAAVMKKALSPATLLPWRYWSLVQAGSNALTVGDDTSLVDVIRFTRAMRSVSSGHGTTTTVPIADAAFATSAGSAVLWDKDKAAAFFADLRRA